MNNNNIIIERAFDIDGLSSFSCGIREIDGSGAKSCVKDCN